MFSKACEIASRADIFIAIGTSLNVYPAASLLQYVKDNVPIYFVDPGQPKFGSYYNNLTHIQKRAAVGVPELCKILIDKYAE